MCGDWQKEQLETLISNLSIMIDLFVQCHLIERKSIKICNRKHRFHKLRRETIYYYRLSFINHLEILIPLSVGRNHNGSKYDGHSARFKFK